MLYTHSVILDAKLRDEDPFLQGLGIVDKFGGTKSNCYGGFKYLELSTTKPTFMKAKPVVIITPAQAEATRVYADMKSQYKQWNGTLKDRGAWWGSKGPGNPAGSKNVQPHIINELKKIVSTSWEFKNSFSGDLSFHRKKNTSNCEFIYHLKSNV